MLQGVIALHPVVHAGLYEWLATGAFWEDVKSTWRALEMDKQTRDDLQFVLRLSDC